MSCRSNQAAAAAPKSRLLELRLLRGEGYSSAAQGRRGPQKEIKDRNVLENKYKAETRLKKWRISPCQSHVEGEGPLTEQTSIFLCAQGKPTFDLPVLDLYMYITHTHRKSTSAAHDHHTPAFAIVHLSIINLVWSALTCSQQWKCAPWGGYPRYWLPVPGILFLSWLLTEHALSIQHESTKACAKYADI